MNSCIVNRRFGRRWSTGLVVVLLMILSACGTASENESDSEADASGSKPEVQTVDIAGVRGADWAWLWIGVEDGIFKEHGLDVTVAEVAPPNIPAALVNGGVQANSLIGTCERAHREGIPLVDIAMASSRQSHTLLATKEIQTLEDLKGKVVIAQSATSTPTLRLQGVLNEAGLGDDVEVLNISEAQAQVAAFRAGQGDAIFEPADDIARLMDEVEGSHVLVPAEDVGDPIPNTGICVTKSFLKKNPKTVRALVVSMIEAVDLILNDEAAALKYIQSIYELNADQATFVYDIMAPTLESFPIPDDDLFENLAKQDSVGLDKPVSLDDVRAAYDVSIAEDVVDDLGLVRGE